MEKILLDEKLMLNLELDLMPILEYNFQIEIDYDELSEITNFDELCSLITSKLHHQDDNICTTQVAFYKLRRIISSIGLDGSKLKPDSKLEDILPQNNRKRCIRKIEKRLGIPLRESSPNPKVITIISAISIISILGAIFHCSAGAIGILVAFISFKIVDVYSKKLTYTSVRDLLYDTAFYNYSKFRNESNSVNRPEFKQILMNWFSKELNISKEEISLISFK